MVGERRAPHPTTILRLLIFLSLLALAPPRAARAQADEPPVMSVVLADLSQRAGHTVTVANFDDWRWGHRTFEDTSLDCPQLGERYEVRSISGYRIIISYGGATYDYRVSRDGSLLALCASGGVTPSPTPATPQPTPLPTLLPPTSTPPGRAVCPNAPPTRLEVGQSARVSVEGAPSQLRAAPDTASTILGLVAPGQPVTVVGGPECSAGIVWWQVDHEMLVGWTAEGQNQVYLLEPLRAEPVTGAPPTNTPAPPRPAALDLPPGRQPITLDNALSLAPFAERPIEQPARAVAWSADGRTLAVAAPQVIWLFAGENLSAPPRMLRVGSNPVRAVAFSPNESSGQMVSAHEDGTLRLWDVLTGGQSAVLTEHRAPVQALAFSPDGALLASGADSAQAGDPATIILWDFAARSPRGRLDGHTGSVRALAFSPDGTLLASGAEDGTVRLWDLVSETPVAVLQGHTAPVLAVAFSPDAALIASADQDGTIRLWDSAAGGGLVLDEGAAPVRALTFAPAGSLLIAGGASEPGGARLALWDAAQQARLGAVALPGAEGSAVTDLLFADGGSVVAILTDDPPGSRLRLWGVTGTP